MAYQVKERFLTLQGEGALSGRAAVFLRFAGCNLWSGREADRAEAACDFCDTDFVGTDGEGGGTFHAADDLARAVAETWGRPVQGPPAPLHRPGTPLVVVTGGEPFLQLDAALIQALHDQGFRVAVESNGTIQAPDGVDWLCVSPKAGAELVQRGGDELKLVHPQPGLDPAAFADLGFDLFFLQPLDGGDAAANRRACVDYCLANPRWRLGLQSHKVLGLK